MKRRIGSLLIIFTMLLSTIISITNVSIAAELEGNGSAQAPYIIKTIDDFNRIPDKPSAYYIIVKDLDFKNEVREPMAEFSGVLDGDGHTLSNLNITGASRYVGLFTNTKNAIIKNIKIYDSMVDVANTNVGMISGTSSNSKFNNIEINRSKIKGIQIIGGFCGYSNQNTSFTNCVFANSNLVAIDGIAGGITARSYDGFYQDCYSINNIIDGYFSAGGLVGQSKNVGRYIRCYSSSSVEGTGSYIGGIIGKSESGDDIILNECFTSGNIQGVHSVGGLIGNTFYTNTIIENSYSRCNLKITGANSYIGGFIGNIADLKTVIRNSYFAGEFSEFKAASKVGLAESESISNSYFDSTKAKFTTPETQARTTVEMFKKSNYEGWDFDNVWYIEEGNNYPRLRFERYPPAPIKSLKVVLEPNEELQLSVDDDLQENLKLVWTSTDESVVAVNDMGVIKAIKNGSVIITVKSADGKFIMEIKVLVIEDAKEYRLAIDLAVGKSCRLTIDDAEDITSAAWSSSDTSVATVTDKGRVTAVAKGLSLIQAKDTNGEEIGQVYVRVR